MTRINEVLYFVLYDLCKIKKTQNKSASVFSIGYATSGIEPPHTAPRGRCYYPLSYGRSSVWCTMHHSEL